MSDAKIDNNWKPTLIGVSSVDGDTPVRAEINPGTGRLLVDASGGSSGTQYAEGATTSPATGTVALGRYQASPAGTLADGALTAPLTDNYGQLKVVPVGTSSTNVAQVGGANVALGQTTMAASVPVTVASNQAAFPVTLTSTSISSVTPGTGATNLGAAVDAARGATKTGVVALAIRKDTAANQVSADGDYAEQQVDGNGRLWTNGSSVTQPVAGDVAAAATDSGNPVKVGAKYNATKPTYTDGQRGDLQIGTRGSVAVSLFAADSTTGASFMVDNVDAVAASGTANKLAVLNRNTIYNGSSWDRTQNNTTGVVIAAGTTTTQSNVALTTYNARSMVIVVNVSAVSGGSITVTINGTTSSSYVYPLLTSAALNTVAVTPLRIFPGSSPSANAVANDVVPRNVTVTVTVTGTITYGVDYVLGV